MLEFRARHDTGSSFAGSNHLAQYLDVRQRVTQLLWEWSRPVLTGRSSKPAAPSVAGFFIADRALSNSLLQTHSVALG